MNLAKFWLLVGGVMGALAVTFGAFGAHWIEQKIPGWYTTDDVFVERADSSDQPKEVDAAAALKELHVKKLKTWMTGVRYHFYHAFAVIAVGLTLLHIKSKSKTLDAAAVCFCLGIGLFSGSIYALVISKVSIFGMFAAVGGVFQLTGWLLFIGGIWKANFDLPYLRKS
jgi:uncharacterized membrane protein YgdD (TMEM256/DUF423 family)